MIAWLLWPSAEDGSARGLSTRPTVSRPATAPAKVSGERCRKVAREQLKKMDGSFRAVVVPPFVVVGDVRPGDLRRLSGFVRWVTDELKVRYFPKDPRRILTVYLFKDRRSYRINTFRLTGKLPDTPFGFYSSRHRALIMNIKTGGGTLSHEIVHPFMEANFPNCPPWLNEGMGSLYEAVGRRKKQIWGFTNWRLPGLQRAIRKKAVPSFAFLTAQDEHQFYQRDPGTNYSQSRYLVYYLQNRGLLHRYYHQALRNRDSDPTGYKTLKRVLGVKDMAAFKRKWEAYVMKLRWR